MRKICLLLSIVVTAFADQMGDHNRFQIGGNYTYVTLWAADESSLHGNLGGAQALYEYRPKSDLYAGAKLAWKQGQTEGSPGHRWLLYVDTQERLGYTFGTEQDWWMVSLFSGLGFRHLWHKFHPDDGDTINFKYNEFYVPVGILTDSRITSWFHFGVGFTWMPQIYPTVTIVPLKGARWIITNKLNNFYVEFPFDFTLTQNKRFHLIVAPTFERWNDGHTTAKTNTGISLGLPGNTYNFWGVDVNLTACF